MVEARARGDVEDRTLQCPGCQRESPPEAPFCAQCGSALSRRCGREFPADARFWPDCGEFIGAQPATPAVPSEQTQPLPPAPASVASGRHRILPYIVSQYLEGGSLHELLLGGEGHRLPVDQALRIGH